MRKSIARWMKRMDLKKLLMAAAVAVALLIPAVRYLAGGGEPVLEAGSWGLSFREAGQPPVADASAQELAVYDAKYIGDTDQKTIYLTFDCGYENGNTEAILAALEAHDAPAAFFVVGHFLETEPDLVRRMTEAGHTVGNHTWSHPDMSKISDQAAFNDQLQRVRDAYQEITGQEMSRYYRPPQGIYSQENLKMAQRLGYKTVFWSLAYVDWKADAQPSEEEAIQKLTDRVHNGAVVLLHNTSSTNAKVLDRVLTRWEEMGYRFGTLDELFGD